MKKIFKKSPRTSGDAKNIREEMSILPGFIQHLLTWITGKPANGQQPLLIRNGISHLFTAYLCLFAGLLFSYYTVTHSIYFLTPIGWLFIVSGARKLMTTINHYCVHKDMLPERVRKRYPRLHQVIADINASLFLLQNFADYREEHLDHHKVDVLASLDDPDMAFMWKLGFRPGMYKATLWRTYLFNIILPWSRLHRLFIWARLKTLVNRNSYLRFAVSVAAFIGLLALAIHSSFLTVFWVWVFPTTYLYHIAALMQFSSEHIWLRETDPNGTLHGKYATKALYYRSQRLTVGRFCGDPIPGLDARGWTWLCQWLIWWFRLVFYHLPVRLFVLPGDLIQHDWHHRGKYGDDWPNAAYAREQMVKSLKKDEAPLMEIWRLFRVIDKVFENLSQMPAIPAQQTFSIDEMVLGM